MSSSYSSLDWVLSHWAHFTVLIHLCFFPSAVHTCHIIVSAVGWTWWDWSLILGTLSSSMLWHCMSPSLIWPIMC